MGYLNVEMDTLLQVGNPDDTCNVWYPRAPAAIVSALLPYHCTRPVRTTSIKGLEATCRALMSLERPLQQHLTGPYECSVGGLIPVISRLESFRPVFMVSA